MSSWKALWARKFPIMQITLNGRSNPSLPNSPQLPPQWSSSQTLISDVCSQTLARRLKASYFQRCLLDHRKLTHPCPEIQWEDRCFTISPALYLDIFFQLSFHSAQIALCFLACAFNCCRWFSLKFSLLALGGELGSRTHNFDKLTRLGQFILSLSIAPHPQSIPTHFSLWILCGGVKERGPG